MARRTSAAWIWAITARADRLTGLLHTIRPHRLGVVFMEGLGVHATPYLSGRVWHATGANPLPHGRGSVWFRLEDTPPASPGGASCARLRESVPSCCGRREPPTVTVEAAYSKHRREGVQPIPPTLATELGPFITNLARGGVHPKQARDLARHSDMNLTLSRYRHTLMGEQAAAASNDTVCHRS